ncbi:MAG TPA: hypothetical protein VKO16_08685 [Polyangia bacterium]|nr:hypothetical protein [Polyangia bacterium]
MLSSMNNPAPSDNVVLRHAVEQIQRCLPSHWSTSVATKTNDAADARLTIKTPAGASAALAIGARRQLDPRLVAEVAGALKTASADAFLIIAPFLGARTRERLADAGIGFVDLVGNIRLVLDRPTVFIAARGEEKSPWAGPRATRSLHAAKASRIVRALADGAPPFGVRQLAVLAGTDPGYVSRLLDIFDREELIEREIRGPVVAVEVARLLRRWSEDYRFGDAHRFVPLVHPHGVPGALAGLRDAGVPYALTARAGAAALLGTALPGVVAAYVDNPERVARLLGLEAGDTGANLMLIDPFDPFVFEGAWEASGLRYAARSQIIADLLGSPPPGPAQATTLLGV